MRLVVILCFIVVASIGGGVIVLQDSDSVPIQQELQKYNTDPFDNDTDDDKLSDYKELQKYNTNPKIVDTDTDELQDGVEVNKYNTNPKIVDTDTDGLSDSVEINRQTNPKIVDTDTDGFKDGAEVNMHNTNPLQKDTDTDGLTDGVEVNNYQTDPTNKDSDTDTLSDNKEINQYDTNPTKKDTDNDNLIDGEEIQVGTDLLQKDTDTDGLIDGAEVNKYNTNPKIIDTDNDGFDDAIEVNKSSYNPSKKDIFLEVDVDGRVTQDLRQEYNKIISAFADAPIKNPNGTTGIDLHIIYNEVTLSQSKISIYEYQKRYKKQTFNNISQGYYHLLVVDTVCSESCDQILGVTTTTENGALVQSKNVSYKATGTVSMHELGHILGLTPQKYEGIDSQSKSFTEYPSVMNYNTTYTHYDYSSGKGYDDWKEINKTLQQK